MAKYLVSVVISACVGLEVEAHDEKEAQNLAIEEIDPFMIDDWFYEIDYVSRNEEDEKK